MPPVEERLDRHDALSTSLLERSAPLGRSLADALCRTNNGRDDCGALHGVWLDLRLLNLAADPQRHADFYGEALGTCAATDTSPRVLISACADWGMLAATVDAYRRHGARLDVTVIDRCPTPLLLCAWYGSEVGVPIRTAAADASQFDERAAFDVICTHSLLTYAPLDGRRRLVANWHRLLRRGGVVVTVTRLQQGSDPVPAQGDPGMERARLFGDIANERLQQLVTDRLASDRDIAQLRARAERFAVAQISHPVGSDADLRALFEQAGFDVIRLDVRHLPGMLGSREPIGGAARSGAYGEIVAVKR